MNPLEQFAVWFQEAKNNPEIKLPDAMCLSTVDEKGFPDARMVLLKGFDESGFVFYTNFNSPKAKSLLRVPQAALTFYWEKLKRQVRIRGTTKKVSEIEADAYFKTRPRDSQIGAWASDQSATLDSRATLEKKFQEFSKKFEGAEVPRPKHWGGFRLVPSQIEFWTECPNRLHDRFLYIRSPKGWAMQRLAP